MLIDLNKLYVSDIKIDSIIAFEEEEYKTSDIKRIDDIKVLGNISINNLDEISIDLNIKGYIYLEDALSLELVKYPIDIKVEDIIDYNDEYYSIDNNKMNLKEFVWKNIVLEIPIRVVKDDLDNNKISGDGWSLNEETKEENVFSKLNDLFKK